MDIEDSHAKAILKALEDAGEQGLTREEIARVVGGKICNCENWVRTFLEAGIIEKIGKSGNVDRYRLMKQPK